MFLSSNRKSKLKVVLEDTEFKTNTLLFRMLINKRNFFDMFFPLLIDPKRTIDHHFYMICLALSPVNMHYIFSSTNNMDTLLLLLRTLCKPMNPKVEDDHDMDSIYSHMYGDICIELLQSKLNKNKIKDHCIPVNDYEQYDKVLRKYKEVTTRFLNIRYICKIGANMCKLNEKNEYKCGNICCNKNYLQHKYGLNLYLQDKKPGVYQSEQQMNAWKSRTVVNKWYCSRHCQKVAWNKQNHVDLCIHGQQYQIAFS
eukprot:287107_1